MHFSKDEILVLLHELPYFMIKSQIVARFICDFESALRHTFHRVRDWAHFKILSQDLQLLGGCRTTFSKRSSKIEKSKMRKFLRKGKAKLSLQPKSKKGIEDSKTNFDNTLEVTPSSSKAGKQDRENNETSIDETQEIGNAPCKADEEAGKKAFTPICELWDEAYENLRLKEGALIQKYESILSAEDKAGLNGSAEGRDKRTQLEHILKQKRDEVEKNAWKLKFSDEKEVALKDLAEPVLSIVEIINDYIGTALSSNPYTSIAWVGVGLMLPLFLNPSKQGASSAKGLEYVSNLIAQSSIREELYHRRYESSKTDLGGSLKARIEFRDSLRELYLRILKFQAKTVCHYSDNGFLRLVSDFVKWNDWDSLMQEIQDQERFFQAINAACKDQIYEEECFAQEQRHKESMKVFDSLGIDVSSLRVAIETAQQDSQRTALLNWLSTIDASENYNNARKRQKGPTGNWLINEDDKFKSWQTEPNSLLWLHGKAGSGKTILSSTAIEYLERSYGHDPQTALGYFYFSFNDAQKQDTSGMLSSLIKQLCSRRPNTPQSIRDLVKYKERGHRPDLQTLEITLEATIRGFSSVFIVIDALDECPYDNGERRTLLESLCRIEKTASENLHLLCTSRQEHDIKAALDRILPLPAKVDIDLSTRKKAIDADIGLYIDEEFNSTSYDSWTTELKELARATLLEKADGMFQYVSCQFEALKDSHSVDAIEKTLENLPEGLDATYDRILLNLKRKSQEKVVNFLKWLAFSLEPLSLDELAETFALDHRRSVPFDEKERLLRPEEVLVYLRGLVTTTSVLRRGENVVEIRFAHFSIQEYLVSSRIRDGEAAAFFISHDDVHLFLADSCLAYHLHISQTELATEESVERFPLWRYAATNWGMHLDLIVETSRTLSITEKAMQVLTPGAQSLLNMIRIGDPDKGSWENKLGTSFDELGPPLYYTASQDMYRMTIFLIDRGADVNHCSLITRYGTALQAAVYHDNQRIVHLLLDKHTDVNAQGGIFGNALQAAAYRGNLEIIHLLLEKDADVNTQGGSYGNALRAAVYSGGLKVVQLLLEKGADINAQGDEYGNALQAAVFSVSGNSEMIQLLLEKGANINTQGGEYGNVLQAAASWGNLEIFQLLLENGANVNAQGGRYGNALQAAAIRGHLKIAKLLLENCADVNAQGGYYGNVLVAAIVVEEYEVARLLISHGAKSDLPREVEEKVRSNIMKFDGEEEICRLEKFRENPEKFMAEIEIEESDKKASDEEDGDEEDSDEEDSDEEDSDEEDSDEDSDG